MSEGSLALPDEASTEAFGAALAAAIPGGAVLHLRGELGAGKTTLSRGLLRALGHRGAVRSPTYTLIEPYEIGHRRVFHMDLYRIAGPGDLEGLGIRDCLEPGALLLIEWPDRGGPRTPAADLVVELVEAGPGRRAAWHASSAVGEEIVDRLAALLAVRIPDPCL